MKPEPNAFCLYVVFYFNTGPFYSVLIQDLLVRSCSWRWINRYKLQYNVGQGKCPKVGLNVRFCDWGTSEEGETSFGRGNQERLPSRAEQSVCCKSSRYQVSPAFQKFVLLPLHFYERRVLGPVSLTERNLSRIFIYEKR